MAKAFDKAELIQRAFYRVAYVMHGMWEETGSSDTRLLNPPLISYKMVIIGESVSGKGHKEHIIPRKVICDKCHRMFDNGEGIAEVANFIQQHLKIVHISTDEQKRLDQGKQLGLRQKMPNGWKFGDDIYARLKAANIVFTLYS